MFVLVFVVMSTTRLTILDLSLEVGKPGLPAVTDTDITAREGMQRVSAKTGVASTNGRISVAAGNLGP